MNKTDKRLIIAFVFMMPALGVISYMIALAVSILLNGEAVK